MSATYHQLVNSLRQAFPQPVSDRVHDSYFVFSFRARSISSTP